MYEAPMVEIVELELEDVVLASTASGSAGASVGNNPFNPSTDTSSIWD